MTTEISSYPLLLDKYIIKSIEIRRNDYWKTLPETMKPCLSQRRFNQIHRFLTINYDSTKPKASSSCWWNKVEPLTSTVRANCQRYIKPSSWVAVDEAMVAFYGKSKHSVKIKGKPIK